MWSSFNDYGIKFFGISISVPEVAQIAADNGNWGNGRGWNGGMPGFKRIADKYGLKSKVLAKDQVLKMQSNFLNMGR